MFGTIIMINLLTIVSNNIKYDEREGVVKEMVVGGLNPSGLPILGLK